MLKAKIFSLICFMVFFATTGPLFAGESNSDLPVVPTPGMVTMVDFGADKCIPCLMMAPVIDEVRKEYAGRASIIFVDVRKHHEQAQIFGIRGIPTQVFYDKEGKETERHVGFMDKKSIVAILEKMGATVKAD